MNPLIILYLILIIFYIPLLTIIATSFFYLDFIHDVARAVCEFYNSALRSLLLSIILPILTLFTFKLVSPNKPLPRKTTVLLIFLFFVFLMTLILYIVLDLHPIYSNSDRVLFKNITSSYSWGTLSYIAILFGVNVKPVLKTLKEYIKN